LVSVGSSYMIITIPFVVFILFWLQMFYLRTSRQMRLLDLEAKTPLYRQFTETLEGLATIRAYAWQSPLEREAITALEESQKPYYLLYCIQLWLNITLELVSSTLAVILVSLALLVPTSSDPGLIGIGMTTAMMLTGTLQSVISAWTDAETSLGSLARTRTFERETPNENLEENNEPGFNWPQGRVQVSGLSVKYETGAKALSNVDFEVEKGQKVGICGRTGRQVCITLLKRC
jgi:ATP-binding cassette, subfamily C (CFTR/MRP), member 1